MATEDRVKFEKFVLFAKAAGIVFLLVLSFVNGHTSFVTKDPKMFLAESLLTGVMSAAAFAFIAWSRGQVSESIINVALLAFLAFFIFNVFMEFSGFNQTIAGEEKLAEGEKKVMGIVVWIKGLMGLLAAGAGVYLASQVRDTNIGFLKFMAEGVLLAIANSLPLLLIGHNRKADAKRTRLFAGIFFVLFFVLHVVLQLGGFYAHIFPDSGDLVKQVAETVNNNTAKE
jgi:hypothetical protein